MPLYTPTVSQATAETIAKTAVEPSAFSNCLFGAKTEAGAVPIQVRTENGGTVARLRGNVKVKALEEVKPGETVLELPAASFRPNKPTTIVGIDSVTAVAFPLQAFAILSVVQVGEASAAIKAGQEIEINASWSLT